MKILFTIALILISTEFCKAQKYQQISGPAQGTTFHITYQDKRDRDFEKEINQILQAFDSSVSTYNPNSIISQVNKNNPNVKLDAYFVTCFQKAKEIWSLTNGAFDPTVYPLVNAWGFGPEKKSSLEQKKIDSLLQFVGFEKIELVNGKIIKKDPRVQLDFNAFAQGYSVDVVSSFFLKKGVNNFVVEIGGEVYAHGLAANQEKWRVAIEQPIENKKDKNEAQVIIELMNKGVATSGNYRRFIEVDGKKLVHHIDPRTGYPTSNNLLSASVFCDQTLNSDALATGFLVMGLDNAKLFLEKHPEIQVFFIYADEQGKYQVFMTKEVMNWIAQHQ
ncbi:MAG: hypothetical protein RL078_1812 [Bacteroidota bacterium]|jgi:thiamine biosynthesis lipoprotein